MAGKWGQIISEFWAGVKTRLVGPRKATDEGEIREGV